MTLDRLFSFFICINVLCLFAFAGVADALSSPNIPLDSPVYQYIEKLAGLGLIKSDFRAVRPFSRSEAARLLEEAKKNSVQSADGSSLSFITALIFEVDKYVPREMALRSSENRPPLLDWTPASSARVRYVYLDGMPRSYERQVHDPGGDGVFGIGAGLRPDNPYPSPVQQHGSEGTPLLENNEGARNKAGSNLEFRFTSEAYGSSYVSALVEPLVRFQQDSRGSGIRLNKGYLKLGGGTVELEIGRDAAWLGPGYRGAITLTNNAENFDLVKLSSPEPVDLGAWGALKYAMIGSRFERTTTNGVERQPWFYALKLSYKPVDPFEIGFNLGRQVGGPGVDNSSGSIIRGVIGGTNADNSNGLAGFDLRYRASWLRNTEFYGEFSGEDTAGFWPIVESYVAGVYVPRITAEGRDDFRFEYFQGNQILYTNGTFPEGYVYRGMPIGHSQGGATQELFFRYSHWFSPRNTLSLEYINTRRGVVGKMPGQVEEQKNALRGLWRLPVYGDWDAELMYGWERVDNLNLVSGAQQTNQLVKFDLSYRY
jgi:hypothetical protein